MKTFYFILETDIIILFNNTIAINDDFMNLSDDDNISFINKLRSAIRIILSVNT
jgi:hypothetical protein